MRTICCVLILIFGSVSLADQPPGIVILDDDFNREETDPKLEQVGNDWGTNSRSRAKGVKQVDLVDGAMHMTRAEVADHGVSVTHEADFEDAIIQLRFKIGPQDDLGVDLADMNEKSVHAGHISVARVRAKQVEISDLKTGKMNLAVRERRLAGEATEADKKMINQTSKFFKVDLDTDQWHQLEIRNVGDQLTVSIDGQEIGQNQSVGFAHPTKTRIRLAVNKSAWVDDVKITRLK